MIIRIPFALTMTALTICLLGCNTSNTENIFSKAVALENNINETEIAENGDGGVEADNVLNEADVNEISTEDMKKENRDMTLKINNTVVPVIWEDNDTVMELKEQLTVEDIMVSMSMYGGNEQVGSLGRSYTHNDKQTTTHNGDIVLYSGNNIVVFYGMNSWSYTRLGKMDLSEDEVTEILSNGDNYIDFIFKIMRMKLIKNM